MIMMTIRMMVMLFITFYDDYYLPFIYYMLLQLLCILDNDLQNLEMSKSLKDMKQV